MQQWSVKQLGEGGRLGGRSRVIHPTNIFVGHGAVDNESSRTVNPIFQGKRSMMRSGDGRRLRPPRGLGKTLASWGLLCPQNGSHVNAMMSLRCRPNGAGRGLLLSLSHWCRAVEDHP